MTDAATHELTVRRLSNPVQFVVTAGLIAVTTAAGASLRTTFDPSVMCIVYLTEILIVSIAFGLSASLFACVLSVLADDFFFIPPLYKFQIDSPRDVMELFLFFIAAILTSGLASRMRTQMLVARKLAETTAGLYNLSRELAGIASTETLPQVAASHIAILLQAKVVVLQERDGRLVSVAAQPPDVHVDDPLHAAAGKVLDDPNMGLDHATWRPTVAHWFIFPLRASGGATGVVCVSRDDVDWHPTSDERHLLDALVAQTGMVIERVVLAEEIERARLNDAADRFRTALLASVSHDLRTPLTSILGALSSLRVHHAQLSEPTREDLLDMAHGEAERMTRFISNLLDITRLESGALGVNRDPVDLIDIVGSAVRRAENILREHHVEINMSPDLTMLALDAVLTEQVLFNLLDNAGKYSPTGSTVQVNAHESGDSVVLTIVDEGEGIPDRDFEKVFDKFYRIQSGNRRRAGTGLGLSICRGFVEAQGGTIVAGNRPDRSGAVFTIFFPTRTVKNAAIHRLGPSE